MTIDNDIMRMTQEDMVDEIMTLRGQHHKLVEALNSLVVNVQDYEAWQRPCLALDQAKKILAENGKGE